MRATATPGTASSEASESTLQRVPACRWLRATRYMLLSASCSFSALDSRGSRRPMRR